MARFAVVRRERMVEPKGGKIARPGNGPGPGGQELSKIAVERILDREALRRRVVELLQDGGPGHGIAGQQLGQSLTMLSTARLGSWKARLLR